MIGKKFLGEKEVTLSKVKSILEKRKERGELTYEQKLSLEYAQAFGKTGIRKIKEALEKLEKLGIPVKIAVKIVDIKPKTKEEVRLIFEKVRFSLKEDVIKKILDIAAELE